jgi:HK97 family phage prohead protease
MDKKEIRNIPAEFRIVKKNGKAKKLEGYAARFDSPSEDLGGFVEVIEQGAFEDALRGSDCRCLFNHNSDNVLGRESSNTLRLRQDDIGLHMSVDLPDTSFAADLATMVERKDVDSQSFSFQCEQDEWQNIDTEGKTVRIIKKISHLYDVGPVTFPAYPQTSAALRSMERAKRKDLDHGLLDDIVFDDLLKDDLSEFDDLLNDL